MNQPFGLNKCSTQQRIIFLMSFAFTIHINSQSCHPSASTGTPNYSAASTGLIPINDLGTGSFITAWNENWTGGLYPGGSNLMPTMHLNAGLNLMKQIQPLDTNGIPNSSGKIVILSIGLSNTLIEACEFDSLAKADVSKNKNVICVNGAQGGSPAMVMSSPWFNGGTKYYNFWKGVHKALNLENVNAKQVQVVWFKNTDKATAAPLQAFYDSLVVRLKRSMHELTARFPNLKLCFISSRTSARYSCTDCGNALLNPEPFAYYQGWACKKIIEDQINGDTALTFTGANRRLPWIGWGPYLWCDGDNPRLDGFNWNCATDVAADGTHPSIAGARKIADNLLYFFKNDTLCKKWFNTNKK